MARTTPNMQAVAEWLADEERKKRVRPSPSELIHTYQEDPQGRDWLLSSQVTPHSAGLQAEEPGAERWRELKARGSRYLPFEDFQRLREQRLSTAAQPPGKLPFISGTPTHPATKPAFQYIPPEVGDPGMAVAMSGAANLASQRGAAKPPAPPVAAPQPQRAARRADAASRGVQPTFRAPEARPYGSPAAGSADRFIGLPEGVATYMRQRSGLADAQEEARRRGMGVELASAFGQIGSGISGARYDDEAWQGLRGAAERPVEDYALLSAEERQEREEERAAQEAAREAQLELRRLTSSEGMDRERLKLQRDQLAQEKAMGEARLRSEALDRGLRRQELLDRRALTEEERNERARLAREQRQQQADERDIQKLAERSQPGAEMVEDISYLNSIIQNGGRAFDAIPGVGPAEGLLPELLRGTEGDKVSQAANRLASNIILAKSGKAATDTERRFLLSSYGIKPGTTEAAWTEGIKALTRDAAVAMRNIEAGFRPEVVRTRAARGGSTAASIPPPASLSTGEEIEMPDGSVYEVLEDGTTRRVR